MTAPEIGAFWLHGTGVAGLHWSDRIAGSWPSLPGHARAPRARAARVEAYAAALIPALPERFVIGGHSLGGMVAMQIAATLPDRCAGLVLVETPLRLPRWISRALGQRLSPLVSRVPGPEGLARLVARMCRNPSARDRLRQAITATPQRGLMDAMRACLRFDGRTLLPRLTMPVLSLVGKHSILTGPEDRTAFARTRVYSAGHLLPFELPDVVADEINAFVEGLT